MANYKGKTIYNPSGKAGEYSYWACNFYVGCSNECTYCYLKKGRGAKVLGGNEPKLKKCFKNEKHALEVFKKELDKNLEELRKHGLFFSFTTDPMLKETIELTLGAVYECMEYGVPVKILTKRTEYMNWFFHECGKYCFDKNKIAIGFTLTGHDELEPNANINIERINSMRDANELGFKTFASIEPVIDFSASYEMFIKSIRFCDVFKIGLESGKKYSKDKAQRFISDIILIAGANASNVYFKDSLLKCAGYERSSLKYGCCVNRDYNIFS